MRFTIEQPETEEAFTHYYHLRWKLLRAPWSQPEGSEKDDIEGQCFHVMAIATDTDTDTDKKSPVIGVARLQLNSDDESQIRYMAVENSYEGQGVGRALIKTIEQQVIQEACETIILDARENAVGFYQKLGYKMIEKSYLLFGEIQHYRMKKNLR